jgi:hypothetical protein
MRQRTVETVTQGARDHEETGEWSESHSQRRGQATGWWSVGRRGKTQYSSSSAWVLMVQSEVG